MNATQRFLQAAPILGLVFVCSCATRPIPAETFLNKGAGRGDFLFVPLHLRTGEKLLFAVDTGSPVTILDTSVEEQLGTCLGTEAFPAYWHGTNLSSRIYPAPELRFDGIPLRTGKQVFVTDLNLIWPNRSVSGILGMDCLRNYCLQLDFVAGKAHILTPLHTRQQNLGARLPLYFSPKGLPYVQGTFSGDETLYSLIDTGDPNDGALASNAFDERLQAQPDATLKAYQAPTGKVGRAAAFPTACFADQTYADLRLLEHPLGVNTIGLRFLARHLVTFNFPKGTMYLKRESVQPLGVDSNLTNDPKSKSAVMP